MEELGVQYNVHKLEFSKNQQKEPWFLEINRMFFLRGLNDLPAAFLLRPILGMPLPRNMY